jgi:hypothetical protein
MLQECLATLSSPNTIAVSTRLQGWLIKDLQVHAGHLKEAMEGIWVGKL